MGFGELTHHLAEFTLGSVVLADVGETHIGGSFLGKPSAEGHEAEIIAFVLTCQRLDLAGAGAAGIVFAVRQDQYGYFDTDSALAQFFGVSENASQRIGK